MTFHTAAMLAATLALAAPGAALAQAFTDPAAIDAAVAGFTGASIGEPRGARGPVDRRLKLARCGVPLALEWHGRRQDTVRVACPDAGWHVFVAVDPIRSTAAKVAAAPVVKRGDRVTVMVRGRGFTVSQGGEATANGAAGEWITVRMDGSREEVQARVERAGTLVIPALS